MDTQLEKLIRVNRELGNYQISSQQVTSRTVYDTEPASSTTTNLRFFENFGGKNKTETNLTEGRLSAQQSLVVKEIIFLFPANPLRGRAIFSVNISSLEVIKRMPIHFAAVDGLNWSPLDSSSGSICSVRMVTDLVIPPMVTFSVNLQMETGAIDDGSVVSCAIKGVGTLFNSRTSL